MGQRTIQSPTHTPRIDFEKDGRGLVLTLMPGERIVVGDTVVVITLDETRGRKARIRVLCSPKFSVHRDHVFLSIKEESTDE